MIVGPEILSGMKLYERKVAAGSFHQIFGAAVSETILPVIFIELEHGFILPFF
jgi:hypothetical protein